MEISVALHGSKRRDICLYEGDQVTLDVRVYRKDGDEEPIDPATVTNLRMDTYGPFEGTIPLAAQFTVPVGLCWRNWYVVTGDVQGLRMTLAKGWILGYGEPATPYPWGNDYGWRWPYGPGNWGVLPV